MALAEKLFGGTSRGALIREGLYGTAAVLGVLNSNPVVAIAAFALMVGSVGAQGIANSREESQRRNAQLETSKNRATV